MKQEVVLRRRNGETITVSRAKVQVRLGDDLHEMFIDKDGTENSALIRKQTIPSKGEGCGSY